MPKQPLKSTQVQDNPMDKTKKPKCKAKNRQGMRCGRPCAKGRDVCNMHGGKTPKGPDSPHYRSGRYSTVLPGALGRKFAQAMLDPEMLSQRAEIAVMTGRIEQLMEEMGEGGSLEQWRDVADTYRKMRDSMVAATKAKESGDDAAHESHQREYREAFHRLGVIIADGESANKKLNECMRLFEPRRKLVESERRRLVESAQVIELVRVSVLLDALADVVKQNVRDPAALSNIQREFVRLLGTTAVQPVDA